MDGVRPDGLFTIIAACIGTQPATDVLDILAIDPAVDCSISQPVPRATIAMALNAVLFHDLLDRVATARAYVADVRADRRRVFFDHGAVRTIDFGSGPTGALPGGHRSVARLIEPLGYREADIYPLGTLRMTGRGYVHADFPELVPQFFVSALHVERFSATFQAAAHHIFDATHDSVGPEAGAMLNRLTSDGAVPPAGAIMVVKSIAGFFGRNHPMPQLADYELLLAESAEAAWIATEGNAFNHATDRVADLDGVVAEQRSKGRPLKPEIERSASGRVRQTAFRADRVERCFLTGEGAETWRDVPGSFYEFIERACLADGNLDLTFDSGNAQGIFRMTAADPAP